MNRYNDYRKALDKLPEYLRKIFEQKLLGGKTYEGLLNEYKCTAEAPERSAWMTAVTCVGTIAFYLFVARAVLNHFGADSTTRTIAGAAIMPIGLIILWLGAIKYFDLNRAKFNIGSKFEEMIKTMNDLSGYRSEVKNSGYVIAENYWLHPKNIQGRLIYIAKKLLIAEKELAENPDNRMDKDGFPSRLLSNQMLRKAQFEVYWYYVTEKFEILDPDTGEPYDKRWIFAEAQKMVN